MYHIGKVAVLIALSIPENTNGRVDTGALFGLVAQSYVSDRWGRKRGILFTSIIVIIGQTLSGASASNHGMFIFARFVTGFGGCKYLITLYLRSY